MPRASLFDRLTPGTIPASGNDQLATSVRRNLQRLLATRLGAAAAVPDLGMPAPRTLIESWPGCSGMLQRTLLTGIQRYEPRLRGVRLTPLAESDGPGFRLAAELLADRGPQAFSIAIRLTPAGHLTCAS